MVTKLYLHIKRNRSTSINTYFMLMRREGKSESVFLILLFTCLSEISSRKPAIAKHFLGKSLLIIGEAATISLALGLPRPYEQRIYGSLR